MKRGIQTSEIVGKKLGVAALRTKNLDEIDYGICDGLTIKEIAAKYPK
jgi:6-phosphofructo-2-kinase/fructose-2,6-biphosphatase 2